VEVLKLSHFFSIRRVFGCVAAIISERKNVHHRLVVSVSVFVHIILSSIHRGLESNDMVEVEAAIFAVNCFCQHSKYVTLQVNLANCLYEILILCDVYTMLEIIIGYHVRSFSSAMCEKIANMVQGE